MSRSIYANDWSSVPIVKDTECINVSGKEIIAFIEEHFVPLLIFSEDRDSSEAGLFQSYTISSALLTRSQICLAEALEIKGVTRDLKKQHRILTSGTSMNSKQLKAHRKVSENVGAEIEKALEKKAELEPEQKKVFAVGTSMYGGATYAFVELNKAYKEYFEDNAKGVKDQVINAVADPKATLKNVGGLLGIGKKAVTVTLIGKGIKSLWPMTISNGRQIVEYTQQNDIAVDKDIAAKVGW
jgi:hypothetical protein